MSKMNIIQAVNNALRLEMARNPKVVVLGEDIGKFGGLAETMDEAIRYPIVTKRDGDRMEPCVLAGPTCDSADVLYEKKPYPLPLALTIGDEVLMPLHPFGTDYLGRDMLARLMHGAQVSLFIGIAAPCRISPICMNASSPATTRSPASASAVLPLIE